MDRRSLFFVLALTAALFLMNQWFKPSSEKTAQERPVTPLKQEISTPSSPQAPISLSKDEETYFVLENEYQQLVFSNVGGALAEINLALKSDKNPDSPVRPIGFDRTMLKEFPYNDRYPQFPYQIQRGNGVESVSEGTLGGYYPLLRRAIVGPRDSIYAPPSHRHYAFNILADDGSLDRQLYRVTRFEKDLIEFELAQSGRRIIKTYTFAPNPLEAPYCLSLTIRVEGNAQNLWLTSGVPEVELISDSPAPSLKYRLLKTNQKAVVEQVSLPKEITDLPSIYPDWVSNSNGFLGLIINPTTDIGAGMRASLVPGYKDPTRLTLIDAQYHRYPPEKYPGYEWQLPLKAQTMQFTVYAGPFEDRLLKRVDQTYSDPATGYNPSYIAALSFHGWFTFISEPFAKFLFVLMNLFYKITSSWGISIILLTIALRVMLYPLNAWSINSTLKMQKISPRVAAIQNKHKKDPKRAQVEIMNLYREQGVNPLTGCFPLLIQLPFLIGMFDLLKSMFELRGATFIPGWIDNLTAPDVLFSWNYPIFFFGSNFHLLPFILGGVMWIQQRFSSAAPKNPATMTDQQKQQKMMGNIMTIVFTVMFYHFPSGLNLYWLSSMALGILQQWLAQRKLLSNPEVISPS